MFELNSKTIEKLNKIWDCFWKEKEKPKEHRTFEQQLEEQEDYFRKHPMDALCCAIDVEVVSKYHKVTN